jgi:hypothetical protein
MADGETSLTPNGHPLPVANALTSDAVHGARTACRTRNQPSREPTQRGNGRPFASYWADVSQWRSGMPA